MRHLVVFLSLLFAACGSSSSSDDAGLDAGNGEVDATAPSLPDAGPVVEVNWPAMGSPSASDGADSFRFGAASAATQLEDQNADVDWYAWTQPEPEGLGRGTDPIGDAVRGYSLAVEDVALLTEMNLDSYRFSVEWARFEPRRDEVSTEAVEHYGRLLDALIAADIRPMITVHHFSNPLWVDDPRRVAEGDACEAGPTDDWLCGWGPVSYTHLTLPTICSV